jgi:membrane associated rhomboid family serine protease
VSDQNIHDETPGMPLAEVGRYERLQSARERGLVIAAMERPHWINRQGREYVLCVEEGDREQALAALRDFEREEGTRPAVVEIEPLNIPIFAVTMTLLALILCFAVQSALPANLVERGVADDLQIRAGEAWRTVTALTLHGDLEHLVSNLSLGIFACAFVFARFGVGAGLLATILSGAVGNAANVWAHWYQPHRSIGSSTALFAGLGLLAGAELAARLRHEHTRGLWSLIVPLGAGLTFLSLFGGAGTRPDGSPLLEPGRVDVMAHLLGLGAGLVLGGLFFTAGARQGISARAQLVFGGIAILLVALSWGLAVA